MYYVARPGESISEIINERYHPTNHAQALAVANLNDCAWQYQRGYSFHDYKILYLPEYLDFNPNILSISPHTHHMLTGCYPLRQLCDMGIHPYLPVAAIQAAQVNNSAYKRKEKSEEFSMLEAMITTTTAFHGGLHIATEKIEQFEKALDKMGEALLEYREAFHGRGQEITQSMRNTYSKLHLEQPYKELLQAYRARLALHPSTFPDSLSSLRRSALNTGPKGFKFVENVEDIYVMLHASRYFKEIGHTAGVVDLGLNIGVVGEAYFSGNPEWKKEAAKAIGRIAGSYIATGAAELVLVITPLGWAAVILGIGFLIFGDSIGESIAEFAWDRFQSDKE